MTRFSVVVIFHLSIFAFSAIVSETTRGGSYPTFPDYGIQKRQTAKEGQKLFSLNCPAEGSPQPLIVWSKDGENINPSWLRFRQFNERELRIKNVAFEDAGLYKCHAVNGFGSADLEYTLVVLGKDEADDYGRLEDEDDDDDFQPVPLTGSTGRAPFWVKSDKIKELTVAPLQLKVGGETKLKCHANGLPTPDVLWYKDNEQLDELGNNRWTFHMTHLQSSDSGKYTCRVVNMFGSLNATFVLDVKNDSPLKAEVEKSFMNTSVQEGQTATFQCKVRSTVRPNIQWAKKVQDGDEPDPAGIVYYEGVNYTILEVNTPDLAVYPNNTYVKQLVISNAKPKDSGWYYCVVLPDNVNRSAYLKVIPRTMLTNLSNIEQHIEQIPVNEQLPLHFVVGIPVGLLLMILVGYAIYFLQKHQQKPNQMSANGRPQPPNYPPPSVPPSSSHKASSSPYRNATTNSTGTNNYASGGCPAPLLAANIKEHNNHHSMANPYTKDYKAYHHLDPMASVPLNTPSLAPTMDRDLYEATPQPYELQLDHSDFSDCYDGSGGRVQHYPSMYSCR